MSNMSFAGSFEKKRMILEVLEDEGSDPKARNHCTISRQVCFVRSSQSTNTLRFARGTRNLPGPVERLVLSFLSLEDLGEFGLRSKDCQKLVRSFLVETKTLQLSMDCLGVAHGGMALRCRKLRFIRVGAADDSIDGSLPLVAANLLQRVVHRCSETMESLDAPSKVLTPSLLEALAECGRLREVSASGDDSDDEIGEVSTFDDDVDDVIEVLTDSCKQLQTLSMHRLKPATVGAALARGELELSQNVCLQVLCRVQGCR